MKEFVHAFTWIWINEQDEIHMDSNLSGKVNYIEPFREKGPINYDMLKALCDNYWEWVDGRIERGEIFTDSKELERFRGKLKVKGQQIASFLLTEKMRTVLWSRASTADVTFIISSLEFVPWEALYFGDFETGAFLGEVTFLVRMPDRARSSWKKRSHDDERVPASRRVFVDSVLNSSRKYLIDGHCVAEVLQMEGEDVLIPETKEQLFLEAKKKRVLHWVCEHENIKGLRLCDDEYFCVEDASTYTLKSDHLLILSACRAGRAFSNEELRSIAGSIHAEGGCTVIASVTNLSIATAHQLIRLINQALDLASAGTTVEGLWEILKKRDRGQEASTREFSTMMLFLSVHGSPNQEVK